MWHVSFYINLILLNICLSIGCIYGKGSQYTGKANVTLSGNECLSWADEKVAHQLRMNVSY